MLPPLLKAADAASQQSDRWLFLFTLLVMGMCFYFATRWLVTRFEKGQETITRIAEDSIKTNRELAVIIDRNNTALNEHREMMRSCRAARGDAH